MPKTKDAAPNLKPFYNIETGDIIKARRLEAGLTIMQPGRGTQTGAEGDYLVREAKGKMSIRMKVGFERLYRPGRSANDLGLDEEYDPDGKTVHMPIRTKGQDMSTEELGRAYAKPAVAGVFGDTE